MALFVLSLCPFDISVGVGAFVIGLSQISSFFSGNQSANEVMCWIEHLDDLTPCCHFSFTLATRFSSKGINYTLFVCTPPPIGPHKSITFVSIVKIKINRFGINRSIYWYHVLHRTTLTCSETRSICAIVVALRRLTPVRTPGVKDENTSSVSQCVVKGD